jgi:GrpB-like predicted nucleotidyltransferase (UPF0157 family)
MFAEERTRLASVFDHPEERIEHVGSTAVVGLPAKPIIDIMVGVVMLIDAEARIEAEYETELPERRYFRRPHQRPRTFHLHCVVRGEPFWTRHVAFRDHLRGHADAAGAYGRLKRDLARRHPFDRLAYMEGKAPFIRRVLDEAMT